MLGETSTHGRVLFSNRERIQEQVQARSSSIKQSTQSRRKGGHAPEVSSVVGSCWVFSWRLSTGARFIRLGGVFLE